MLTFESEMKDQINTMASPNAVLVVIFVVFLLAVQLVIQLRSGDIQPFIYYQF